MITDPIADMLTRIRNAQKAGHVTVTIPASHMKEKILNLLMREGFISQFIKEETKPVNQLKIFLKYDVNKTPAIFNLSRVSRPGGRVYRGYRELRPFLMGIGLTIVSTPKGILTDEEARKMRIGGEVLLQVS